MLIDCFLRHISNILARNGYFFSSVVLGLMCARFDFSIYNFITFKVPVVFVYGDMGHTPSNIYIDEKDVKVSFKNSLKSVTCSPPKMHF